MSKVLYGNKKTGLCREKNIQAEKHLPAPQKISNGRSLSMVRPVKYLNIFGL